MTFNRNLGGPTGPTKSVHDSTFELIDPALATLSGVSTLADAAADGFNTIKRNKAKAKASARQAKIDQQHQIKFDQQQADRANRIARQEKLDARADTVFAQQQDDRASKERSDLFQDRAATAIRDINKKQRAIKQGVARGTSLQIETEKAVTSLLTEFPEFSSELNAVFKENGVSHLTLGDLEDQRSGHDNEREAREAARTSAIKTAYDRGLADDSTPEAEAVEIGQRISENEATISRLNEQKRLAMENRRLSIDEQKAQLAASDRQLRQAALKSTNTLAGSVTSKVLSNVTTLNSPEAFAEFQKQGPIALAQLEEARAQLHEQAGFDKDTMASIDKSIDRQKALVNELANGDFSFAKQRATELKNLRTNAQLDLFEAQPALLELDALPKSIADPILQAVGTTVMSDPELVKGLGDVVNGITSSAANHYRQVTDPNTKATDPNISPETARGIVQYDRKQRRGASQALLNPQKDFPPSQAAEEFFRPHVDMLRVFDETIGSGTQDGFKNLRDGTAELFSPATVSSLRATIENRETAEKGEQVMLFSRKIADRTLRNVLENNAVQGQSFDAVFNERTGFFEPKFNKATADRAISTGSAFSPLLGAAGTSFDIESNGPNERSVAVADSLNQALDFLVRTVDFEKELPTTLQESEYRRAYATGDFSAFLSKPEDKKKEESGE